jgi:hypothetical protein
MRYEGGNTYCMMPPPEDKKVLTLLCTSHNLSRPHTMLWSLVAVRATLAAEIWCPYQGATCGMTPSERKSRS